MTHPMKMAAPFGLHPEFVLGRYCAQTGTTREALAGTDKTREITFLRHEAMWIMRQLTSLSHETLGRYFGNRDMATVHAGIARVADRIAQDPDYRARLQTLVEMIGTSRGAEGATGWTGLDARTTVLAARGILGDPGLSDADARAAALQLLGAGHGA
jgi:hypothetical protein